MKVLFDETYGSEDGNHRSRNIWYGYDEIYVESKYGNILGFNEKVMNTLCERIKSDLLKGVEAGATETNWYFYGGKVTLEDIGENSRATILVREKAGQFITNFNIGDQDFALNIDGILQFRADFEKRLKGN